MSAGLPPRVEHRDCAAVGDRAPGDREPHGGVQLGKGVSRSGDGATVDGPLVGRPPVIDTGRDDAAD